jgi:hypothetical protein
MDENEAKLVEEEYEEGKKKSCYCPCDKILSNGSIVKTIVINEKKKIIAITLIYRGDKCIYYKRCETNGIRD